MVLGDYNARHIMRQDTKINSHGNLFDTSRASTQSFFIEFVRQSLSVNGDRVVDRISCSSKVKAKLMRHFFKDEMALFAGAPRREHVPVLSSLDLWLPKKETILKPDIRRLDARKVKP